MMQKQVDRVAVFKVEVSRLPLLDAAGGSLHYVLPNLLFLFMS